MKLIANFVFLTTFISASCFLSVDAKYQPDQQCPCPSASAIQDDTRQRYAFYMKLIQHSMNGDHEEIRRQCLLVDEKLCVNSAFDFLHAANSIESFGTVAAYQIAPGFTYLDYIKNRGQLPSELRNEKRAVRNLKKIQKKLKLNGRGINSMLKRSMKAGNKIIEQINAKFGEEIVPTFQKTSWWQNTPSSSAANVQPVTSSMTHLHKRAIEPLSSNEIQEEHEPEIIQLAEDENEPSSSPDNQDMPEENDEIPNTIQAFELTEETPAKEASAFRKGVQMALKKVGGFVIAVIGFLLFVVSVLVAVPLGVVSALFGVACGCRMGAQLCPLAIKEPWQCPSIFSSTAICGWGAGWDCFSMTEFGLLKRAAILPTIGFHLMGFPGFDLIDRVEDFQYDMDNRFHVAMG